MIVLAEVSETGIAVMQGKTRYLRAPPTAHCLNAGNCGSCHILGTDCCRRRIESLRRAAEMTASHSRATATRTRSMTLVSKLRVLKVAVNIRFSPASDLTHVLARSFDMMVAPLNRETQAQSLRSTPASGLRRDLSRKSI
jgi:hypothetical protein